MAADALDVIARVPSLARTPRVVTELPGGLTNRNYKVTTPDGAFVARLWAPAASARLLAINRDHEYRNSVIAAAAGVGAPVVEYRPQDGVLVLGFVDGVTYAREDVQDPRNLPKIAAALRALHAAPRFAGDFDMFDVQRRYRDAARRAGAAVPDGYDDLAPAFAAARAALAAAAGPTVPTVPCHNDLLAANFIDSGERVHLIDYEYSGNNDPCFELGNIAGESQLSGETLAALVTAYYGRVSRGKIARARLFTLVSQYGWTLWGVLQHASSPLEFDFWSWAMERFEAAAAGLTSPSFAQLLDYVAKED
ncbi:MAG TPA: choline kinase family protein [Streptosporangiaceae bacterium]|nr:choline kinase family protein [Streptosporangiaceae bacterium]